MQYTSILGTIPGPYLPVRLTSSTETRDVQGLLDTGADQTMIPLVTARELGLRQIGDMDVGDANGGWQSRPLYVVDVAFDGLVFEAVPVIGLDYPVVLIGRDILNELVVTFHGPAGAFVFGRP